MPWTVLLRGKLEPMAWKHDHRQAAWVRAFHLADLHGCRIETVDAESNSPIYIVDAADYYKR
jgi:hypothetical protein